jgi:hypothetical protein
VEVFERKNNNNQPSYQAYSLDRQIVQSMSKPSLSGDSKENEKPGQTKDDKKIAAVLTIRQHTGHLNDVSHVVDESTRTFEDDGASKREKAKAATNLHKCASACHVMSASPNKNVKCLDPIP